MESEQKYFLFENNRKTGPFTTSQIQALISAGEIYSETVCIPKSRFSLPASLDTFFPNTTRKPIDSSKPLEIDEVTLDTIGTAGKYSLLTVATARPVVTIRRALFWASVAWFTFGILLMLILYIEPGKFTEGRLFGLFLLIVFFPVPAYFACRKLEPAYTLALLFSDRRRTEFQAREKEDQSLAVKLKIKRDMQAQVIAEQREKDRALRAQEKAKEMVLLRAKENDDRELLAVKKKEVAENIQHFLTSLREKCGHEPVVATVQGGSGMPVLRGEVVWLGCRDNCIAVSRIDAQQDFAIPYADLVSIEVHGPGTESSNAGIWGGGFGFEGAMKGILIASVINWLTSRRATNTFVRIATSKAEVLLHTSTLEPSQLRLILSPAFVQVEANRQVPHPRQGGNENLLSNEIKKLHRMRRDGALSEEEFTLAKAKLLSKADLN